MKIRILKTFRKVPYSNYDILLCPNNRVVLSDHIGRSTADITRPWQDTIEEDLSGWTPKQPLHKRLTKLFKRRR